MPSGRPSSSVHKQPAPKGKKRAREEAPPAKLLASKPRKESAELLHDAESDSSADDSQSIGDELVDCEMEFYDPKQKDFDGLNNLLRSFVDDGGVDISELVQAIIQQVSFSLAAASAK